MLLGDQELVVGGNIVDVNPYRTRRRGITVVLRKVDHAVAEAHALVHRKVRRESMHPLDVESEVVAVERRGELDVEHSQDRHRRVHADG